MITATVKDTISRHALLSPGDRVVVAVSGGPDSVCLLDLLRNLAPALSLTLHVAHLDHGFRGEESAGEARFVERLAASLGLSATVEHADVPVYCAERGLTAQEGARQVRYAFLERVADHIGAQRIAVGHTANDQAETVLMRLLRGAGLAGLSGIPPRRGRIIRPLLETTRPQVLSHLAERQLEFVTDPSNRKPVYTRNRVRQEVLPVLQRFNPRVIETLAAEADALREDLLALDHAADELLGRILRKEHDVVELDRDGLLAQPDAVRRWALRRAIEHLAPDASLSFVRTGEALGFLENAQSGRQMELPGGLVLERAYETFQIRPATAPQFFDREIAVPGVTGLPELGLEAVVEVRKASENMPESGNYLWQARFDYAKIALPLRLRSRRAGDSIQPSGMGGTKKLQDLFVDAKVPRHRRDAVPVLAVERDVLWVVGMRTDRRFLPGPDADQVLIITIRQTPQGDRR
jgi:tRNA(Ile)-lysidine synthase